MPQPAPVCTPSTPRTNKHSVFVGTSWLPLWASTGGPKNPPFIAPNRRCTSTLPSVASVQQLFRNTVSCSPFPPSPQHAPPWTDNTEHPYDACSLRAS